MYNPITKAARYLRREYPVQSATTLALTGLGLVMSGIAVAFGGAPLLLLPAMTGGFGGMGLLVNAITPDFERPNDNSTVINGVKLVGSRRDIASIHMAQEFVTGQTRKIPHLQELPRRTANRIARHLDDIRGAVSRVRAYADGNAVATSLIFTREMINASGETVRQTVGTLPVTATSPEAAPAAQAMIATPAAPDLTVQFGSLAQKVEKVEQRMQQLEHPAPAALDKPRLVIPR